MRTQQNHRALHRALAASTLLILAFAPSCTITPKGPDPVKLLVQDLKNKYEADNEKLDKVKNLFKFLMSKRPDPRGFWRSAWCTLN